MLQSLLDHFSSSTDLPIEIDEIVAKITELGVQDEIFLFEVDSDPGQLVGAIRQFKRPTGIYREPLFVTHIVFSANVPIEWQRVVCAKELIHIFDSVTAQTDTAGEVSNLVDKLVGPLSSEDYGIADFQAAKDKLALYQALPLLFPDAARQIAKQAISENAATLDEVAGWACIPPVFVELMLSEDWPELNGAVTGF